MVKLVVCCDGTWNTKDQQDNGVPAPTNVVRIANAIVEDEQQRVYYHPGVGTGNSIWDKIIGGGTGTGLTRNVQGAYAWLCENYQNADEIYLFGFSRGAYTVRSLAGFLNRCGLLIADKFDKKTLWRSIEVLYEEIYRNRRELNRVKSNIGLNLFQSESSINVKFLGVWDTVGSLGIPDDLGVLDLLDDPHDHTFHDTNLGRNVEVARHAVAIDERRGAFQPTLWTDIEPGRNVKQIWFPGAHSDVGGGYREKGLSDGALKWMITEAEETKLRFKPSALDQILPSSKDTLHDPCIGLFALMQTQPRSIPPITNIKDFHDSALSRYNDPPIDQSPYLKPHRAKGNCSFDIFAREQWNATGLYLDAGQRYEFEASGEWLDGGIACGPSGTEDGNFDIRELAHMGANILGAFEAAFRRLTDNPKAQFRTTRRHKNIPWFCLVGAIANGRGEIKSRPEPHETFIIGEGCVYVPEKSGYLYAYTNDAWAFYGNNAGYVKLTIL